jgi:hypothetical protein
MTSYNLDFFLEHFEDVCPEDFEGFTQQHFDRIGNMFFAPPNPKGAGFCKNCPTTRAVRLARTKPEKSSALSTDKITCECGSTINKSSMKSHIKTKKHLDYINKVQTQNADDNICIPLLV